MVAGFGRQLLVRDAGGGQFIAVTRGRNAQVTVGDLVRISVLGSGQAVIESIQPRRNEFKRSDAARTKRIAANIDQAGVVIAAHPPFSEELLLRVAIAASVAAIPLALIVNKCDLLEARAAIEPRLAVYRGLGYPVIECSARADPEATRGVLGPWLAGRSTLLLGQSGMGKSTLINCIVPQAGLRTQEISEALGSGRHTTTFTRMFALPGDDDGVVIDSPGFQSFGLEHLSESERAHAMPEYAALLGSCRFHNCTHRGEPGCAIRTAAQDGRIDSYRYRLFLRLADESLALARGRPRRA